MNVKALIKPVAVLAAVFVLLLELYQRRYHYR